MAKLTLYHGSPSRSSIALWMLEELGEPYDVHLLSLTKEERLTCHVELDGRDDLCHVGIPIDQKTILKEVEGIYNGSVYDLVVQDP